MTKRKDKELKWKDKECPPCRLPNGEKNPDYKRWHDSQYYHRIKKIPERHEKILEQGRLYRKNNPEKISKIAEVLQTHYSDSIPVIAKYLDEIDMLNKQFKYEETPAANALHGALYNMGDIEQPIMAAVRLLMPKKKE